jgi:putative transposase
LGSSTPGPRTIQRLRRRQGLLRLPQRALTRSRLKRVSRADVQRLLEVLHARPALGSERLAWDLQNEGGVAISPATIKRYRRWLREGLQPPAGPKVWRFYERHHAHSLWQGDCLAKVTLTDLNHTAYQLTLQDDYSRAYVFCDLLLAPTVHTAITALIAAMRRWQVIPKAVLFDNGSPFRGKLLESFCRRLGIQLIHTAVRPPQINGKLERAFRDDMTEFYQRQPAWRLEPLRQALPAYVHYRNTIRGHRALGGKPASTRLQHPQRTASPQLLRRLEWYARAQRDRRRVSARGSIRLFGQELDVGRAWAGCTVVLVETLQGLEFHQGRRQVALLPDYRWSGPQGTSRLLTAVSQPLKVATNRSKVACPRIAVAY